MSPSLPDEKGLDGPQPHSKKPGPDRTTGFASGREALQAVLERRRPPRIPYAPNYWQWFAYHREHGLLPKELAHAVSVEEVLRHLGCDVFSRNLYCDNRRAWWGGLSEEILDRTRLDSREFPDGRDLVIERTYHTPRGPLDERLRYVHAESTLVQERFLVQDPASEMGRLEALAECRSWRFNPVLYRKRADALGHSGFVVAGEVISPLKFLHVTMGPENAVYFLTDEPEAARAIMALHEASQLDLVRQIASAGVPAVMAMDNLDSAFHPPALIEACSARFYEKAAAICHEFRALFFIHACGQQRDNLALIASLGVDGLEGVAFPPVGDVALEEAMRLSGDRLIITGGITAPEFGRLRSRAEVFAFTEALLASLRPFAHRFIFASSCNTPYSADWSTIRHFRDAWLEFSDC